MIIALVNQKGGVGKSTLAICIAAELVARGRRVLLVDADPQRTAQTWHDLAVEAGRQAPSVVAMTSTLHQPHQLPQLAQGYDDVVIDTPPRLGTVLRSALVVADVAILPCGPSAPDAWALAETLEILDEARTLRPALKAAIVLNRKRAGTALADKARRVLGDATVPVLESEIGLRQAFAEAIGAGQGVAEYAPGDAATRELKAFVDEVLLLPSREERTDEHGQGSTNGAPQTVTAAIAG